MLSAGAQQRQYSRQPWIQAAQPPALDPWLIHSDTDINHSVHSGTGNNHPGSAATSPGSRQELVLQPGQHALPLQELAIKRLGTGAKPLIELGTT